MSAAANPCTACGACCAAFRVDFHPAMLEAYRQHVAERAALGIPPLPLTKQQTSELVELLKNPPRARKPPWSS
jgi:Fe-S-cluster containining protein